MKFAHIEKSKRLQRVRAVLPDGLWHSTLDLVNSARACAINSAVSELRENGIAVECHRMGANWFYRMGASHA